MAGEGGVVDTARADKRLDLERRVLHRIFWPALVILIAVGVINVMTLLTEAQRAGTPVDVEQSHSGSASSPACRCWWYWFRWSPPSCAGCRCRLDAGTVALPLYLSMSMVFSGVHVLGMVALPEAGILGALG